MDDELDVVFSAQIDEEYGKNRPEEVGGVSQNHEAYFENDFKVEDDDVKENCCISCLKGKNSHWFLQFWVNKVIWLSACYIRSTEALYPWFGDWNNHPHW